MSRSMEMGAWHLHALCSLLAKPFQKRKKSFPSRYDKYLRLFDSSAHPKRLLPKTTRVWDGNQTRVVWAHTRKEGKTKKRESVYFGRIFHRIKPKPMPGRLEARRSSVT